MRKLIPTQNSRTFLLIFLASLAAFGPFVTDFYLPTLPAQTIDFQTTPAMVQLGLSTTMWGLAIGQLFVGPISDRKGRRGPLIWSLALYTAATYGAAAASSIEIFLAMRFLEGLGASGGIVMSRSIAADRYAGRELGAFMAVMGAIQGIAPVSAPMIGAFIADSIGWRGIFWLLFAIGAVLFCATLFRLAETRRPRGNAAAVSAQKPAENVKESCRILIGDPIFVTIVLQQIFASAVLFGHISSSPFIFQNHFGLSPAAYGMLFGGMALSITVGAAASTRVSTPTAAMLGGAVGMAAASVLVGLCFAFGAALWLLIPCYVVMLISLGFTLPAAMTAALSRHRARSGLAAAILGAVSFCGGGLVAPMTALGDPTISTSIIFAAAAFALVAVGLATKHYERADLKGIVHREPGEPIKFE